jgi:hypothetical protein
MAYLPLEHGLQDVDATIELNVPAAQLVQEVAAATLYAPLGQDVHPVLAVPAE